MSATPLWERSKENAAPLERGRNVKALEASFAAVSDTQRQQLEKVVEKFESRVTPTEASSFQLEDPVDDPLIHWVSYIKFHQDNFPSDTHAQFLLFERCMRALCRIPKYSQDPRFVRVCCLYAEKTQEPTQIFKHLYQQKIGTELAMFWMAFSFVAEKEGDYQMAKNALDKGIRKKAKPVQQLENRLRQFQRRMARHWLNATQDADEMDSDQDQRARGVLGALSEDEVRRNDRGGARRRPVLQQRIERPAHMMLTDRTSSHLNREENATNTSQGFAIFEDGENRPSDNFLFHDESTIPPAEQVLERQEDRIKENYMHRQRWNEQGAYSSSNTFSQQVRPPMAALPAFAIHVDEDCAAEHQRQEAEAGKAKEAMRRKRDERTFRERGQEDLAERLKHDPLMYVKDPSRLEQDKLKERESGTRRKTTESGHSHHKNGRKEMRKAKRRPTGYQIKLLRGDAGQEQSFEEARALRKYYSLLEPSTNFSTLPEENEEISEMSLDESDVSMEEEKPQIQVMVAMSSEDVVMPTPRNTSTASSAVDETFAVGITEDRVEPTINTKIAVNELSMMFASPSIERANRSMGNSQITNQSALSESAMPAIQEKSDDEGIETATFSDLGQSGGVNSSFAPVQESPPKQFDIFRDDVIEPQNKHDGEALTTKAFSIYSDEERQATKAAPDIPFSIHKDGFVEEECTADKESKPAQDSGDGDTATFSIFEDAPVESRKDGYLVIPSAFATTATNQEKETRPPLDLGDGDTAPFSIFEDIPVNDSNDGDLITSDAFAAKVANHEEDSSPPADHHTEDGDTATFSIFEDAPASASEDGDTATFSVLRDGSMKEFNDDDETASLASFEDLQKRSMTTQDHPQAMSSEEETLLEQRNSICYSLQHAEDLIGALGRLDHRAEPFPKARKNLFAVLSAKRKVYKLPDHCMPRCIKKTKIKPNEEIRVSKSSAWVEKELGRGSHGVVTLIMSIDGNSGGRMAMKSQTISDSLAWEFEVLSNLQDRVGTRKRQKYPFPVPYSMLSFQDGSLMTMSAASTTGLTLLDLVNNYKTSVNNSVMPEILAIYYASRMLLHIEILHHRGKILHCDVKADNWVLVSSDIDGEELDAADIQLLDFGRAVDMTNSGSMHNSMYVGQATRSDMRCVAMRRDESWSYDVDTFGVCDTAHTLLYGENMELDEGKWMPKKKPCRYHQRDLWEDFFSSLLKLEEESGIALGSRPHSVRQLRQSLESHLEEKRDTLNAQLKHQATFLWSQRPSK